MERNHTKREMVCVIIPCYKSEKTIQTVVKGIWSAISREYDYKIILVNDCSPDNVLEKITQLCAMEHRIVGINLAKNYGQQAARMAAMPYVEGDYVVFMDDDGQHPADGILKLIASLKEGYDIAYALFKNKQESKFKQFGSWVNRKMTDILIGKPKEIRQSSFFAMKIFVAKELLNYDSPFPYIFGYLMKITQNITNVEIEHLRRLEGDTGYTLRKLFRLWLNGFTGFSVVPLRLASFVGVISAVFGFLWGAIIILRKLMIPEIAIGYSSLMAVILFVGGIIMIMLGLIGEYIGRIFITMNHVPQYVIKEKFNCESTEARPDKKEEVS